MALTSSQVVALLGSETQPMDEKYWYVSPDSGRLIKKIISDCYRCGARYSKPSPDTVLCEACRAASPKPSPRRKQLEALPHALYRVFGEADRLLYIGISNDFGRRWKEHAAGQPWWDERRRMTVEWHDSRSQVEAAEVIAIRAEGPKYNKLHAASPEDF